MGCAWGFQVADDAAVVAMATVVATVAMTTVDATTVAATVKKE